MGEQFVQAIINLPTKDKRDAISQKMLEFTDTDYENLSIDWGMPLLGYHEDEDFHTDAKEHVADVAKFIHTIAEGADDQKWSQVPSDCGIYITEDLRLLITGGTTWGDSPTESYDYILAYECIAGYLGISL